MNGIYQQSTIFRRFLSHRIWSILLIIVSVILLFLGHGKNDVLHETRQTISTYTTPVLSMLSKPFSMANEAVEDVTRLVSLKQEVDRLKEENDKLRHLQTVATQQDIKLKQLQSFLNLKLDPRIKYLTARVIADLRSPYKNSLRVNVGTLNDVHKGQAVIDQNGLLGQVVSTGDESSIVLLITDVNSRIPVRLEPGGVSAMLVGRHKSGVELKYLPYGFTVKNGVKVYTSGQGALLPAGIPVGEVEMRDARPQIKVYGQIEKSNYVQVLGFKEEKRSQIKQAVMKLAPPPSQEITRLRPGAGQDVAKQKAHMSGETAVALEQITLLNLEKGRYKKKIYRKYKKKRYYGWRYRQYVRDRRWQAQVFSGGLN